MKKIKILIDVMGGDNAPHAPIEAAVKATNELDVHMILVGDTEIIEKELKKYKYEKDNISIAHAPDVISNYDEPAKAVRQRKEASVVVASNMLKNGDADAMLSMGSTGALLTAGLLIVGRIKGILRPAIATVLPTGQGPRLLIDAGANTNCRPANLVQFGIMGDVYMHNVHEIPEPRVGIISNGEEEGKGDDLTKKTYPLMKNAPFNFIGNIEGRDIMEGNCDVMVCDGFVGNVVLKTVEGMGHVISKKVKGIFKKNLITKIGALFVMSGLNDFKKSMDYREYGGAPLLGCKKPVIKGHGSSDAKAIFAAIKQAKRFISTDVISNIEERLKKINTEEIENA
ncbi:MAG: phosphate acyltransferase PlsX [Clostridia bacterium]|jgi:glycerol-3-phosphate acyltransferase PlsX|nr:phosphate acyltransferase PlsX [Clostridia bacterium]